MLVVSKLNDRILVVSMLAEIQLNGVIRACRNSEVLVVSKLNDRVLVVSVLAEIQLNGVIYAARNSIC